MWKGDTWYQVMMRLFVLTVQCRTRANRIGKHHMLNSIVESYLALHPGDKDVLLSSFGVTSCYVFSHREEKKGR